MKKENEVTLNYLKEINFDTIKIEEIHLDTDKTNFDEHISVKSNPKENVIVLDENIPSIVNTTHVLQSVECSPKKVFQEKQISESNFDVIKIEEISVEEVESSSGDNTMIDDMVAMASEYSSVASENELVPDNRPFSKRHP